MARDRFSFRRVNFAGGWIEPPDHTIRRTISRGQYVAFSESLAARTRDALARENHITEKKMFGGLCFLLHGKMLVGVWRDSLIARLGPDQASAALRKPHVGVFDVTGRPMKGWVIIEPEGVESDTQLKAWTQLAIEFVVTLT